MLWQRAFSWAFLFHAAIFGLCVFMVKVPSGMYRAEVSFLGPVLRSEEVSPSRFTWSAPVAAEDILLISDMGAHSRAWRQGVVVDKPDLFKNAQVLGDEHILRFSGDRVELDEPSGPASEEEPVVRPMKLRLDHS